MFIICGNHNKFKLKNIDVFYCKEAIINSGGSRISQRGGANFLRCQLTGVTSRHFTINKQKLHM